MDGGRGYRGWMAAITVAAVLSLVFLAVEKHQRVTQSLAQNIGQFGPRQLPLLGIWLSLDPRLAGREQYPRTDEAPLKRQSAMPQTDAVPQLRRPPEPAANVALAAPVAMVEINTLPLHGSHSRVDYLMEALDGALESPIRVSGLTTPVREEPSPPVDSRATSRLPSPQETLGSMPIPHALLDSFASLRQFVAMSHADANDSKLVWSRSPFSAAGSEVNALLDWTSRTEALVNRLVVEHGLEHPASVQELKQLADLASEANRLGGQISDSKLASFILRTAYAIQRRVAVWTAVKDCLDGSTIGLALPRNPELARQDLLQILERVREVIATTNNAEAWEQYLLLSELREWADPANASPHSDDDLSLQVLTRMERPQLTTAQREFLEQDAFKELARQLALVGRDPVDYRQLLSDLEQIEVDPISRVRFSVADSVQALRYSSGESQRLVARTINDHYRNANMRVSVSGDLLERFLPNGNYEIRPVRQRILGADTRGNSAVRTQLKLELVPDETAWNIGIDVAGDMHSNTRSSKGPATFHNSSTAQFSSQRYIRLDSSGYEISSQPTHVDSRDYLQKMSTNFDGLPVFGDFLRLVIREQFNQKRSVAQRITRRIIAKETDAELDRQLEEGLAKAQQELQSRLIGPLERLKLNPMVVDMSTSQERLTIRYRVAGETQLAAHSPRPRAPTDSLMSVQLHQSSINNSITQLGLNGRTWTLEELAQRIGEVFGQTGWELPLDVREEVAGITVRFAETRPATVEMEDGRLRLTLRIAELSQPGRLHIERFAVHSNYIPYAEGLNAGLIRDGVVEIVSNQGVGDRLTLRVIFAKIFVSHPEIPLISESWRNDDRSEGLAVSQLDILDGWLAVALSESDSALAVEVAARARELQEQLR